MNRREFGKIFFKGAVVSLITPTIITEIAAKTYSPAVTLLGKELSKAKLLSPGWHRVRIVDITERLSKTSGLPFINVVMRPLDEDANDIHQYISERYPYPILHLLEKACLTPRAGLIDLNDIIGKEIKVRVKTATYNKNEYNQIEVV